MPNGSHDTICNSSPNRTFQEVVDARLSRRGFLGGGVATAATVSLGGIGALLDAVPVSAKSHRHRDPLLGFQGIPVSSEDAVTVPPGYTAKVLVAWGDPLSNGPAFKTDGSNTAADQALQWGMHNDGMVYFPLDRPDGFWDRGSDRESEHGLLVQNHEYTDDGILFPDGNANWTSEKTRKSQNAHGVSVVEIKRERRHGKDHRGNPWDNDHGRGGDDDKKGEKKGEWKVVRPSRYARRLTGRTPMKIGGPVGQWGEDAADPRLITSADPSGRHVLGTINNCAMGFTPWGTYLACEENFNGYFRKTGTLNQLEQRYGFNASGAGYLWHTTDKRFDVNQEPNEANRFGWVVEFDPFNPHSMPVKRTALGRLKHEGAWVQEARDGRLVVYMGDDEQFEYIYRYVSNRRWRNAIRRGISPLDEGILYVARFNEDGTGEWLPLAPGSPGLEDWSLNDILINTRSAADAVGATPMDRPEWIDTFPEALTVVGTLTNNSNRGIAGTNPRTGKPNSPVDGPNPRGGPAVPPDEPAGNPYGHIIRWKYANDFSEPTFYWDIFALGGDPAVPGHGSTINGDKFGSPDGIYVAPSGRLWIQTDVSASTINTGNYAGFGNNQMLCADPTSGEVRRFLVGPNACEVTGVFVTPDERTMFVGIQHPGEPASGNHTANGSDPKAISSWPDGDDGGRPRSSCVVITKNDGGPIGS